MKFYVPNNNGRKALSLSNIKVLFIISHHVCCTHFFTPSSAHNGITFLFIFRKAMKLLGIGIQLVKNDMSTSETPPEDSWVSYINSLYGNNLGCLHLLMKNAILTAISIYNFLHLLQLDFVFVLVAELHADAEC